jgi:AraC-like DNA-binding protein
VVRLVIDLRRRKRDTASLLLELVTINLYHQLLSWLIGERIRLLGASVTHSLPANFIPMANLLVVPIQYSQPSSELVFSAHYLQRPVVRSYGELRKVIDYFPFDIWYSGHVGDGLSDRVRIVLMAALQRQLRLPASEAVAQLFHMSVATLQRKLQAENTSYAKIRADCQRECAEYLLTFTELTVQEIGAQIGFSDDRAFRRAFHSWNGASPAQFRCAQPVEVSI